MRDTSNHLRPPAKAPVRRPADSGAQLAQILWCVLLLFVLYILVARLQATLHEPHPLCVQPHCSGGQIPRDEARTLRNLGLPINLADLYDAALRVAFEATFIAVGALIVWRRPGDRMALFTAFTLLLFGGIAASADPKVPTAVPEPLSAIANGLAVLGQASLFFFFYLFPAGRPERRWIGPVLAVLIALQTLPLPAPPSGRLAIMGVLVLLAPFVIIISVQVHRFRTVSTPAQRQQTKWVVYGMTLAILGFFCSAALLAVPAEQTNVAFQMLVDTGLYGFFMLIPLAIGFAMLRYRLWDVDVLINRTLVYGPLTVCLALLYVGGVLGLPLLFRMLSGQASDLVVAVTTLAVAGAFHPLRRGIQSFIDRRFYRRKYDASRTLSALGTHLRDDVELDQVSDDIVAVVQETMQPSHVSLWIR